MDYERVIECPIRSVRGAWRIEVAAHNRRRGIVTPPYHLVHLVLTGDYVMNIGSSEYAVCAGQLIYYAARETVDWVDNDAPVTFYSIAFEAPGWTMGRLDRRVVQASGYLHPHFRRIVDRAAATQPGTELEQCQALQDLLVIWQALLKHDLPLVSTDPLAEIWWEVESFVRSQQDWRMPVDAMATRVGRSRSTLHRACMAATGCAPAARLRELRLQLARELLLTSPLRVSAIAEQLGYGRVQEFSREFSQQAGVSPSALRQGRR